MRRQAKALLVVAALCSFFAIGAAPAFAAKTVVNTIGGATTGTVGSLFNNPRGVAINTTGNGGVPIGTTYVVDGSNARIQQFDPSGAFVRTWGWGVRDGAQEFQACTVASQCRAGIGGTSTSMKAGQLSTAAVAIAIDQATGNLYVGDQTSSRRINVFSPTGVFQGAFGWGVANGEEKLQFCTTLTGCSPPAAGAPASGVVPGGQFGIQMGGLAVDSSGNVYLANKSSRRVDVFKPVLNAKVVTGIEHLRSFGWGVATGAAEFEVCTTACRAAGPAGTGTGQFGNSSPSDVGVDAAGNVYALDSANKRIQQFSSAPVPVTGGFGAPALSAAFGTGNLLALGVDPNSGNVLVAGARSSSANQIAVQVLSSSGDAVELVGTELTPTAANGLAVGKYNLGANVVVSSASGGHRIYVINDAPTINAPTAVTPNSATFGGEVVSNGAEAKYRFEYSSDGGQSWLRSPATDALAGTGPGSLPVSQSTSGLIAGTEYLVRLVGIRPAGGSVTRSAPIDFDTPSGAPLIGGTFASSVGPTGATLAAYVNPNNESATYHFEYGTTTAYGASAPFAPADIGSGSKQVSVSEQISGLEPGTTYHFRVVVVNGSGQTNGPDVSFTTLPPGVSPGGRAYEMVSPPDKNGYDVLVPGTEEYEKDVLPISSADGNAVAFTSHSPFGEDIQSNAVYSTYFARRSSTAWATKNLTPPVDGTKATTTASYQWYDEDLSRAYLQGPAAPQLLPEASEMATNLFAQDLATYAYTLLTPDSPEGITASPASFKPWIADTNSSGTLVVFSATAPTEFGGAPFEAEAQLYRFNTETEELELLGREPGTGTPFSSARIATPNVDTPYSKSPGTFRPVSEDASKVYFYAPWGIGTKQLYLWEDGAGTTQHVSGSQRAIPDPNGPKAATFYIASSDGERVFFTSAEKLTDDATTGPLSAGQDLYMYEPSDETLTDLVVDSDDENGAEVLGVLGASEDGTRVYFAAEGVLAPGAIAGQRNLYLWVDDGTPKGEIRFLAPDVSPASWGGLDGAPYDEVIFSRVTPDGSHLLFQSDQSLTGYDNGGSNQVFVYDAGSDRLTCASCNPSGAPATGNALALGTNGNVKRARILSDDGRFAFFETTNALVKADVNERLDVYGFDATTGQVELISSGTGQFPSYLADASSDGLRALFQTRQQLVGIDTDSNMDVYQARVGGGLAGQNPPAPPLPCIGEACRPPIQSAPPPAGFGSTGIEGPGNAKEKRKKKNKKNKKNKTNKKKAKKKGKGKQKKRAKSSGNRGQGR